MERYRHAPPPSDDQTGNPPHHSLESKGGELESGTGGAAHPGGTPSYANGRTAGWRHPVGHRVLVAAVGTSRHLRGHDRRTGRGGEIPPVARTSETRDRGLHRASANGVHDGGGVLRHNPVGGTIDDRRLRNRARQGARSRNRPKQRPCADRTRLEQTALSLRR
jgi:hypothetical protein